MSAKLCNEWLPLCGTCGFPTPPPSAPIPSWFGNFVYLPSAVTSRCRRQEWRVGCQHAELTTLMSRPQTCSMLQVYGVCFMQFPLSLLSLSSALLIFRVPQLWHNSGLGWQAWAQAKQVEKNIPMAYIYVYIFYIGKDESFWCFDSFFFSLFFGLFFAMHNQQKLITSRC